MLRGNAEGTGAALQGDGLGLSGRVVRWLAAPDWPGSVAAIEQLSILLSHILQIIVFFSDLFDMSWLDQHHWLPVQQRDTTA